MGIPTVTIISEAFVMLAEFQAGSLGYGQLTRVVVPHPYKTISNDAVADLGQRAGPVIARALLTGRTAPAMGSVRIIGTPEPEDE
jgi:hypothetical protein